MQVMPMLPFQSMQSKSSMQRDEYHFSSCSVRWYLYFLPDFKTDLTCCHFLDIHIQDSTHSHWFSQIQPTRLSVASHVYASRENHCQHGVPLLRFPVSSSFCECNEGNDRAVLQCYYVMHVKATPGTPGGRVVDKRGYTNSAAFVLFLNVQPFPSKT